MELGIYGTNFFQIGVEEGETVLPSPAEFKTLNTSYRICRGIGEAIVICKPLDYETHVQDM